MWKATGTAFFQRSELDLSALSHFSAGGQLLHPSEVKSSMSELCVSPLSNVVAGIGDAGSATISTRRSATLKPTQIAFIVLDLTPAGINDPGYNGSGNRCHHFFVGSLSAHSLEQVIADAQRVGYDGEPGIDRATRAKEACIDHVKIIQLMRFAVAI